MNGLMVHVPIQTVSANQMNREHWTARNRRKKEHQKAVYFAWKKAVFGKRIPKPPCVVTLTRFGPRLLDSDNAVSSFKGVRDVVADLLGIDDGDPRIKFEYLQMIDSDYAITIQVESNTNGKA